MPTAALVDTHDHYALCAACVDGCLGAHDHAVCTEISQRGDTCACLCRPCATCQHPHGEHHVDAPSRCCEDGCACLGYDYGMAPA